MTIDDIRRLAAEDMQAVDAVIRARLRSEVALVNSVSEYIIAAGGKRLRPLLNILASGACGARGCAVHELAAVIEFIHTATLLHDDVVDESEMRRGRSTANSVFGNPPAVLVGDFLYSRAFQMMVGVRDMRVMEVLSEATNVIAEGEVLQLMNARDPDLTEDAYLHVIRYKTAKLFEAAGRLGAVLGRAGDAAEGALAAYGMHLGTAFQLIDDVLDYSGDLAQTGKNLGDDLAEGKATLPLIYAMRQGTAEQRVLLRRAIESGGEEGFEPVERTIQETGALNYVRAVAAAEARRARQSISVLPDSQYKQSLLDLPSFAVERSV